MVSIPKADYTISPAEIAALHVAAADTTLSGTALQNKKVFDALPERIAEKLNNLAKHVDGDFSSMEISPQVLSKFETLGWEAE